MRNRDGFTIVEILLALLLLSFMVMGFQAATGEIIHYAAQSDRKVVAAQLAHDRIQEVRLDPDYLTLKTRYEGLETKIENFPRLARNTQVTRVLITESTGVLDYHRVTVTVTGDGLREPVARTIVVAAP